MNTLQKENKNKIAIIGAGFAGLSAACYLAQAGYSVSIYDNNDQVGGRARIVRELGYTFDMGPSWYWMPDIFDEFFGNFNKKVSDYYDLIRLDPSYRVFLKEGRSVDVPASLEGVITLFEDLESGSGEKLKIFLKNAKYYYDIGMYKYTRQPSLSLFEYAKLDIIKNAVFDKLLSSLGDEIDKSFKNEIIRQILKFPVLFLGSHAKKLPLMYSLMNYADLELGTWYPKPLKSRVSVDKYGGFSLVARSMAKLAEELGVNINVNSTVTAINTQQVSNNLLGKQSKVSSITVKIEGVSQVIDCNYLIGAGDYQHIEQNLLSEENRKYSQKYWDKRVLSPSSLLFYIGYDGDVTNRNKDEVSLEHHNLFFDESFDTQLDDIYIHPRWTSSPLMYVNVPSLVDNNLCSEGKSTIFVLIPSAPNLEYKKDNILHYTQYISKKLNLDTSKIELIKHFGMQDFKSVYNSFKGNAYGLANTVSQTGPLKPKVKAKNLTNMYFAGQMTVPGPGVPPSILSGQIAAKLIIKSKK